MKPTMALQPLVFALAAVMAMAAQAGGGNEGDQHGHKPPPHQITAGATATAIDAQDSDGNVVNNQGTQNTSTIGNSLNGSSGNMAANTAAGTGNQQDNAAAIASDEAFIFGTANGASSLSTVSQVNNNNYANNYSTSNLATIMNSGNGSSGNMGLNSAAGDFNQQKNNMAISSGTNGQSQAIAASTQSSTGLVVENQGVQTFKKDTLTGTFQGAGAFVATGVAKTKADDDHGSHGGYGDNNRGGKGKGDSTSTFVAVGAFELGGVTTQQVLTPTGWTAPVTNNASVWFSGNGSSGNIGVNSVAGYGNQQANSLSVSSVSH
ncbi:heme utilization protein [Pseudomonas sp. 10S4]|jgi:hypothetical protein|uniref:heme utilization protein n=1 Tax=Pseudomonas sp. 10S4 TaxID=3048583 RepID=UPI002AC94E2D|nr:MULTISPECIES: heme utilization protein [unclassified Pseudomonas]MEB0227182.1 heme utilization protein [Pseudomonas sp. 5S1]MEB0295055.1 heme utilization protein [Pseudomonas sp. 10S4]WPX17481.1 heme utilization protein [Pseudomonas sp. 10S4]